MQSNIHLLDVVIDIKQPEVRPITSGDVWRFSFTKNGAVASIKLVWTFHVSRLADDELETLKANNIVRLNSDLI